MVMTPATPQPLSQPTSDVALDFATVSFSYAKSPVVEQVSLLIATGEMVGLLGPNGAGKSTILKLASGIIKPQQGHILLQGQKLATLSRGEVARRVAMVPQDFSVQFAYTVRQIVEMGRMPHIGTWGIAHQSDKHAVQAALEATNVAELADRVFNELSGGERQRVLIALALAQDAAIVLLDEPTAHLDIRHQVEILDLLRRLNREHGLTVIAALHDLNLAARYFPRLILFAREIVADGPPAQVLEAATLSRVYETPVQIGILRGEEYLSVLPPGHRESQPVGFASATLQSAVHVLAGGGAGELVMRALADAHISFTAGPLNSGDSDAALAQRLAELCIVEPPYAPVSAQGLASAHEHMLSASAVIVCPMPLGKGNIALLEAALGARNAGVPVLLYEPAVQIVSAEISSAESGSEQQSTVFSAIQQRDFSGQGVAVYQQLLDAGAIWVASYTELLADLRTFL